MNILLAASGEAERASQSLEKRGIKPAAVVQKEDLSLRKLAATIRRSRKNRPDACYIFCRQIQTQFNRFPLKAAALLCGVKRIHFCDDQVIGPGESPARVVLRDLPLYVWHCLYGFLAVLGFCIVHLLLRLHVFLRKPPALVDPPGRLCYIKTDFWHDLKAGGSVTHTREFVNAGCDSGCDIRVFSCDPLVYYKLKPRVEVIQPAKGLYDLPIFVSQMEYNLRFPLAVRRRLRGETVGGIYQRNSANNFSGVFLSALLGAPFVLEYNTSLAWAARNWSGARSAWLPRLCERLNLIGAYRVAVVSETLKKGLVSAGLPEPKVIVNPNGVDPVRFGPHVDASPVRSGLPAGRLLIGFIGVFGQWHGVLTLMGCVKHVVTDFPGAHFVIIGDGALKSKMVEILARDEMEKHVTFVGLVPHDAAPAYLNACEVLVSPHENMADGSVFFGSPTKIFEYMAMGKAIAASNVGQLGQLLESETDALLVDEKQEEQLGRAIVRLLRDPGLRQRLGAAARAKVMSAYTWEENFRRVLEGMRDGMRPRPLPAQVTRVARGSAV